MNKVEALKKIDEASRLLPVRHGSWLESIAIQLQYCRDLLQGKVGPERVEKINMGYMAVREFDGYGKGSKEYDLTELICEIDYDIKIEYFSYAQKVENGIHKNP